MVIYELSIGHGCIGDIRYGVNGFLFNFGVVVALVASRLYSLGGLYKFLVGGKMLSKW